MDAPSGTVIAFATSPGSVASDGPGRNGLYTQYLVESVHRPGLKIEEVFKQVRAAVRRDSGGQQTPWESTSLEGDFYFHPVDLAAAEAARRQQEQARLEELVRVAIAHERERIRKELKKPESRPATLRRRQGRARGPFQCPQRRPDPPCRNHRGRWQPATSQSKRYRRSQRRLPAPRRDSLRRGRPLRQPDPPSPRPHPQTSSEAGSRADPSATIFRRR